MSEAKYSVISLLTRHNSTIKAQYIYFACAKFLCAYACLDVPAVLSDLNSLRSLNTNRT